MGSPINKIAEFAKKNTQRQLKSCQCILKNQLFSVVLGPVALFSSVGSRRMNLELYSQWRQIPCDLFVQIQRIELN